MHAPATEISVFYIGIPHRLPFSLNSLLIASSACHFPSKYPDRKKGILKSCDEMKTKRSTPYFRWSAAVSRMRDSAVNPYHTCIVCSLSRSHICSATHLYIFPLLAANKIEKDFLTSFIVAFLPNTPTHDTTPLASLNRSCQASGWSASPTPHGFGTIHPLYTVFLPCTQFTSFTHCSFKEGAPDRLTLVTVYPFARAARQTAPPTYPFPPVTIIFESIVKA